MTLKVKICSNETRKAWIFVGSNFTRGCGFTSQQPDDTKNMRHCDTKNMMIQRSPNSLTRACFVGPGPRPLPWEDWKTAFVIFSSVSTAGTLQEGIQIGQGRSVSIYVAEGYRWGIATGIALGLARPWKKWNYFTINASINELQYFKILQGIAFGSSPYRFP